MFLLTLIMSFISFKNYDGFIESCSGWKLNRYPVVKDFIKGPHGAKNYERLKISFVPGHNPDLITTKPLKRTDLTVFQSSEELHSLMITNGFIVKPEYLETMCLYWIQIKLCFKHKTYIEKHCRQKCSHREL